MSDTKLLADLTTCSLARLAAVVTGELRSIGDTSIERFGHRKVFVSAVYQALTDAGDNVGSLSTFKARLVQAHAAGFLELARADFVPAMQRDAVAASEIRSPVSEFHFVIDREAREPWVVDPA